MNEWDDIFSPSASTVESLIKTQFPDYAVEGIRFVGEGWDSVAYRAGDWVFRFPRRPIGVKNLETERRVLPELGWSLLFGEPTVDFPYAFLGVPFRPGIPLEEYRGARREIAISLAETLARLHRSPLPDSAPDDTMGKADPVKRRAIVERLLGRIPEWVPQQRPQENVRVLLHGDVYSRHIYVSESGRFEGLIDWGDLSIGHPAVDLGCAWHFDRDDRAVFWQAYGSVSEDTVRWAAFRALYHALLVKDYAEKESLAALFRETDRVLRRLLPLDQPFNPVVPRMI